MITIVLPYPPSVNSYWRHLANGRTLISQKGRIYKFAVARAVMSCRGAKQFKGRLQVRVQLHPADRRKRDIDNSMKALLDGLQSAGVYEDDSQIDRLMIERRGIEKGGVAVVTITELGVGDPPIT